MAPRTNGVEIVASGRVDIPAIYYTSGSGQYLGSATGPKRGPACYDVEGLVRAVQGGVALQFDESAGFNAPIAFGAYRVLHQAGSGVLGPVFRAFDTGRDRLIAIKAFTLDLPPEKVAQLTDRLRRIAALPGTHPAIVRVFEVGLDGTTPYAVMPYHTGETLDVAMRRLAPASLTQVLPLVSHLSEAIDQAALDGVTHGALHPRDIFVTSDGDLSAVTGFGIARAFEECGLTPPVRRPYVAPERASGSWDVRADVFSLGVIAHELLTRRRPIGPGEQDGEFAQDILPGQRVQLRKVLAVALAQNPDERFQSAASFARELEAIARRQSALPFPEPRPQPRIEKRSVVAAPLPSSGAPKGAPVAPPKPVVPASIPAVAAMPPDGAPRRNVPFEDLTLIQVPRVYLDPPQQKQARSGWPVPAIAAGVSVLLGSAVGYVAYTRFHAPAAAEHPQPIASAKPPASEPPPPVATEPEPPPPHVATPEPETEQVVERPAASAATPPRAPEARRPAAPKGQLVIRSAPSGALVTIDGRKVGETPATVRDLPFGTHAVQVARPGHVPRTEQVTLAAATPHRTLTFELEPGLPQETAAFGAIDVDSRPRGARVLVDGRFMGHAPLRVPQLRPGAYTITLELGGYRSLTQQVGVTAGKASVIRPTLQSLVR